METLFACTTLHSMPKHKIIQTMKRNFAVTVNTVSYS